MDAMLKGRTMSNAEELLAYTQKLFRELRRAWWLEVLQDDGHERDDETEAQEQLRDKRNAALRAEYDSQTEQILCGAPLTVAPWSGRKWIAERTHNGQEVTTHTTLPH